LEGEGVGEEYDCCKEETVITYRSGRELNRMSWRRRGVNVTEAAETRGF